MGRRSGKNLPVVEERGASDLPDFYRSAGGNPAYDRFKYRVDARKNIPRLSEILEGQFSLDATGARTTNINYSRTYAKIPLITGLILTHTGKLAPLPIVFFNGSIECYPVTTSYAYVELRYNSANPSAEGEIVKYKLRVYDLSLFDNG